MTPYTSGGVIEAELNLLFEEMDRILFDTLPYSLLIPPANIISLLLYQQHGILLPTQEIWDAYLRYEKTVCKDTDLFGGAGYD